MADRDVLILRAVQGAVPTISGKSRAEQVLPLLQSLLGEGQQAARQVQEIHWHGGEDEYWLGRLGEEAGFGPTLARFFWPATPLLTHTMLHAAARAIQCGDREQILLAQESAGQVVLLLLGVAEESQGRSPLARVGRKAALSGRTEELLAAAGQALQGAERDGIRLVASARRFSAASPFAGAEWLLPGPELPGGDLFLLAAAARHLGEKNLPAALLLSSGSQRTGLLTVLERMA